MHRFGELEVLTEGNVFIFRAPGGSHGVRARLTADELRKLSAFLQRAADAAKEEECTPRV